MDIQNEPQHKIEMQVPDTVPAVHRTFPIKHIVIVIVILTLLGFAWVCKSWFVAALVDGHPITRLAVIKELEKQGGKDTLDLLINKQLIANAAKSKHIVVSDSEVSDQIKKYEEQYSVGGGSLDNTLAAQNLTRADLKEQIIIQKTVEKLVADKIKVSDDEVAQYIKDKSVTLPAGQEEQTKSQIKDELSQQKLAQASSELITELRSGAKIHTFVKY